MDACNLLLRLGIMPSLEKHIQILMPIESPNLTGMSSKGWFFPYLWTIFIKATRASTEMW